MMRHEVSLMESGAVDEFAGIGIANSTKVTPNTQFSTGSVLRALQDMTTGCEAEHWLEVGCISTQVCPLLAKAAELFAMDVTARAFMASEMAFIEPVVPRARRRLMSFDLTDALGRSPAFDFLVDVLPANPITAVRRVHARECPSPPKPAEVAVPSELLMSSSSEESSEDEPSSEDEQQNDSGSASSEEDGIVFDDTDAELEQALAN